MNKSSIPVSDPFGAVNDPALPELVQALNPNVAEAKLKRGLPRLSGEEGKLSLKAIRVIRHKPGRRCVVEYDVRLKRLSAPSLFPTIIGKIRAGRSGKEGYRFLDRIWKAGFASDSADEISVPEPLGVVSNFRMWFQRKVRGRTATQLLTRKRGIPLAARIAEAIHKVHRSNVSTDRSHTMADELRILRECLGKVEELRPDWSGRLNRVNAACERLAESVPASKPCGIHRDFYPAQVIVDGSRIYLIDFDLYCMGDPALDIGNFLGHMTEQSLRELGNSHALPKQQQALEERFLELAGEAHRPAVRAYTILTLVRHIFLSTQFVERKHLTENLLELCEGLLFRTG